MFTAAEGFEEISDLFWQAEITREIRFEQNPNRRKGPIAAYEGFSEQNLDKGLNDLRENEGASVYVSTPQQMNISDRNEIFESLSLHQESNQVSLFKNLKIKRVEINCKIPEAIFLNCKIGRAIINMVLVVVLYSTTLQLGNLR